LGGTTRPRARGDRVNRRDTLIAGGTLAAMGAAALVRAQTPGRTYRVGFLGYTAANTAHDERVVAAFVQHLRELGFCEGRNLVIEWRYAEGNNERYAEFGVEMARWDADLVVASSGAAARAVVTASRDMPVVVTAVGDPVRSGLVVSLSHPGGQVTGIANFADELVPKRLELAPYRGFGVTLSYGPEYAAIFHRAAEYVARILNSAKPADMPMEQPTKFEFVVNLKIARSIGLPIPRQLLLRADDVIE
jgi:ABC-type uncharacterized transport system substrate-binding protein